MLLTGPILAERFGDLDLSDPFFDSLKSDYREFPDWFERKHDNEAWVLREGQGILAFLYLKEETGSLDDVEPPRAAATRLKAGTMKVEAQGTRLGERFLRLMFDQALERQVEEGCLHPSDALDGAQYLQRLSIREYTREAQTLAGDLPGVSYPTVPRLEAPNRVQ